MMDTTIKSFFFTITDKYVENHKNYLGLTPKDNKPVFYSDTTLDKIVLEFTNESELSKKYWVECNVQQMFLVLVNTKTGPIMMCDTVSNNIINLINNSMVILIENTHKESITLPNDVYESLIKKYGIDSIVTSQMYDTVQRLHRHINILSKELEIATCQDQVNEKYVSTLKENIDKVFQALNIIL